MEANEGRTVPNPTVSDTLNRLVKTSLVEKNDGYSIADRLLEGDILNDTLPEK